MDFLRAEIARKRKAIDLAKTSSSVRKVQVTAVNETGEFNAQKQHGESNNKRQFIRASDLRRFQDEYEVNGAGTVGGSTSNSTTMGIVKSRLEDGSSSNTAAAASSLNNTSSSGDRSKQQSQSSEKNNVRNSTEPEDAAAAAAAEKQEQKEAFIDSTRKLSPIEVTQRLRSLGLPVRFYGERTILIRAASTIPSQTKDGNERVKRAKYNDAARKSRLRDAERSLFLRKTEGTEADEFRLGIGYGSRNPFLGRSTADNDTAAQAAASEALSRKLEQQNQKSQQLLKQQGSDAQATTADAASTAGITNSQNQEETNETTDPHKQIHRYFKTLLRNWEDDLSARDETIRKSLAGRNESKTLKQCRDYIRPLFKLLKSRKLEEGLLKNIHDIVLFCGEGEFLKAHDVYINNVAIGRHAWPMGVTMVGIHARSGRAKIESSNVAHVMNSELQRKYLTSVKRLMSYDQKKRVDVLPSKKVLG
mmetsp:Transcript_26710/g.32763  ORF Transcript_26710/g.32763 Transcript_26710/m.32763 type:complete len:476 (-) Transcript_26710:231-1658(-)